MAFALHAVGEFSNAQIKSAAIGMAINGALAGAGTLIGAGIDWLSASEETGTASVTEGVSSDYVDVTKPGSRLPNRETSLTPQEFGDNLEAAGFRKSARGDVKIYTKGNTEYDVYPQARSTNGPSALVKVGGEKAMKIRLQK